LVKGISTVSLPPNQQDKEQDWGLSLAIMCKAHGSEMKVESKEGEGSTFIINLPNYLN